MIIPSNGTNLLTLNLFSSESTVCRINHQFQSFKYSCMAILNCELLSLLKFVFVCVVVGWLAFAGVIKNSGATKVMEPRDRKGLKGNMCVSVSNIYSR